MRKKNIQLKILVISTVSLKTIFMIIKSSTRRKNSKPAIHTIHFSLNLELNWYRFITILLIFGLLQVQVPVRGFRLKKLKLLIILFRQYNLNLLPNLGYVKFCLQYLDDFFLDFSFLT